MKKSCYVHVIGKVCYTLMKLFHVFVANFICYNSVVIFIYTNEHEPLLINENRVSLRGNAFICRHLKMIFKVNIGIQ